MRVGGLWRNPEFLKLWTGQAISQIGSRISREGLPLTAWLVLGATPVQMGLLTGIGAGAVLLPGLFAGAWVDRLRRRPVLIGADLGRAALLATVPIAAGMHRLSMLHLALVAGGAAGLSLLFDIAYQAYVPSFVERDNLMEGNSKLALTESIAEIAGPGITGLLVQLLTAPVAILFDAVSFVCSAISIAWIRKPESRPERHPDPHIGREIMEGLRVSLGHPMLRALAARSAMLAFFAGFPSALYVLFVVRDLGVKPAMLGLIIAVGGVSNLAGALCSRAPGAAIRLRSHVCWLGLGGGDRRADGSPRTWAHHCGGSIPRRLPIRRCFVAHLRHTGDEFAAGRHARPLAGTSEFSNEPVVSRGAASRRHGVRSGS